MYTQIWSKYLPIIKILLKRTVNGDQVLDLNRIDFERAGSGRKAGYKFSIEFTKGRVANIISGSPLASDLALVMLEDPNIKTLLVPNSYIVSLNTKFQLSLKNVTPKEEGSEVGCRKGESGVAAVVGVITQGQLHDSCTHRVLLVITPTTATQTIT
jgi:hypothetical protein